MLQPDGNTMVRGSALALILSLGACGGGSSDSASSGSSGGGGSSGSGTGVAACGTTGAPACGALWDSVDADAVALYDRVDALSPTASMPVSGTASYNGYVLIEASLDGDTTWGNTSADQAAIGALALSADFGSGAVTGTMSNFGVEGGDTLSGTVGLSNGTISGNALSADAQGTLVSSAGNIDLDLALDGTFVGTNAAGAGGDVSGTVTWNGVSGTVAGESSFAVER